MTSACRGRQAGRRASRQGRAAANPLFAGGQGEKQPPRPGSYPLAVSVKARRGWLVATRRGCAVCYCAGASEPCCCCVVAAPGRADRHGHHARLVAKSKQGLCMHPAPGRADRHGHPAQAATMAGAWQPAAHHRVAAEGATVRDRWRRQARAEPPAVTGFTAFRKDLFGTLFPQQNKPPLLNPLHLHTASHVVHSYCNSLAY
jgi:hypothetical protein